MTKPIHKIDREMPEVWNVSFKDISVWNVLRIHFHFYEYYKNDAPNVDSKPKRTYKLFSKIKSLMGLIFSRKSYEVLSIKFGLDYKPKASYKGNLTLGDVDQQLESYISLIDSKSIPTAKKGDFQRDVLYLLKIPVFIFVRFCYGRQIAKSVTEVKSILAENVIPLNYERLLTSFYSDMIIWKYLLRKYKIKKVLNSSTGDMPLVYAANKLGLKTYEVQHGVLGMGHFYNNSIHPSCKAYYPQFLFSKGTFDIENYQHLTHSKMLPTGSFMMDYLSSNSSRKAKNSECKITRHLCTLQNTCDDVLVDFIENLAEELPNHEFVFLSKDPIKDRYRKIEEGISNMSFIRGMSFYEIVGDYDTHISIYSACVIEAPSFGVKSIVLEIFDQGKEFTDSLPKNNCFTFVKNPDTFKEAINQSYPSEDVLEDSKIFCNTGFQKNVISELLKS